MLAVSIVKWTQGQSWTTFDSYLMPVSVPFSFQQPLGGSGNEIQFWTSEKGTRPPIGPAAFLEALALGV